MSRRRNGPPEPPAPPRALTGTGTGTLTLTRTCLTHQSSSNRHQLDRSPPIRIPILLGAVFRFQDDGMAIPDQPPRSGKKPRTTVSISRPSKSIKSMFLSRLPFSLDCSLYCLCLCGVILYVTFPPALYNGGGNGAQDYHGGAHAHAHAADYHDDDLNNYYSGGSRAPWRPSSFSHPGR